MVIVITGVVTIGVGNVVLRDGIAAQISTAIIDVFREPVDNSGFYHAFCINVILVSNIAYCFKCDSNHSFLLARI